LARGNSLVHFVDDVVGVVIVVDVVAALVAARGASFEAGFNEITSKQDTFVN
jgi:hypothetical protein